MFLQGTQNLQNVFSKITIDRQTMICAHSHAPAVAFCQSWGRDFNCTIYVKLH